MQGYCANKHIKSDSNLHYIFRTVSSFQVSKWDFVKWENQIVLDPNEDRMIAFGIRTVGGSLTKIDAGVLQSAVFKPFCF